MSWDEIAALINGTPPAHLATADGEGHPHVAVVAPVVDGPHLVFLTGARSAKIRDVRANPQVAFVFEGNGAETYVWGSAEVTEDVDAKRALWSSGTLPYDPVGFFGSPENESVVLVRVTPSRASAMRQGPDGPGRDTWSA